MRFTGEIAGVGTTSGTRLVVGAWQDTPYGPFVDVMLEQRDGHRVLLAPTDQVAEVITGLYTFDEVVVGEVTVSASGSWRTVIAPGLVVQFSRGDRTTLGAVLRVVPRRIATSPRYLRALSAVAGLVLPAVRTFGSARDGRRVCYGATDVHRIDRMHGTWRQRQLGQLTAVDPPVRFGFGSTPKTPGVTTVVTTVLSGPEPRGQPLLRGSAR